AGQAFNRELCDESLRRLRHDHADEDSPLAQAADQFERLIGRDAPTDDQENATFLTRGHDVRTLRIAEGLRIIRYFKPFMTNSATIIFHSDISILGLLSCPN